MRNFKATIYIKGAHPETIYRDTYKGITKASIKALTKWKPGMGSLYPDHYEVYDYYEGAWKLLSFVRYTDVPEDQHEWRKPKTPKK